MIFVTVGAQMPFDRLVGWADAWAEETGRDDVDAQIGPTEFAPRRLRVVPFLDPQAFRRKVEAADAVIAHAGMGTILTVLELGRPLLVVPRLGAQGETRNDHQVATAERLESEGLVHAAFDHAGFRAQVGALEAAPREPRISAHASQALLDRLRIFVSDERDG